MAKYNINPHMSKLDIGRRLLLQDLCRVDLLRLPLLRHIDFYLAI